MDTINRAEIWEMILGPWRGTEGAERVWDEGDHSRSKPMVEDRIPLEQEPAKEGGRLMRFGKLVKGECSHSPAPSLECWLPLMKKKWILQVGAWLLG